VAVASIHSALASLDGELGLDAQALRNALEQMRELAQELCTLAQATSARSE